MPEDRLRRSTLDPRSARSPLWARAMGVGRAPPLPRAQPPRLEPLRRSWLAATWHARIGVQAGLSLDDFLRSRLARYLAALPVPRARLPVAVEIEDGQLAVRPSPGATAPAPGAAAGEDAWLTALVAVDGPPARREIAELEIELATVEGEIAEARRRADERGRQLSADVAVGLVAGPPDVEATAEQLGRPPIRSGAPRALAVAFAGGALAAETWQVALPFLAASGLDPSSLRAEAVLRPAEVAFAVAFSLAVATALFALVHAGVEAALGVLRGDGDARRQRWTAGAALVAGGAAVLLAAAVAALRAGAEPRLPGVSLVLLLLAAPVASDLVLRAVRPGAEARAREIDAALAWDRERARSLSERARRLEELSWAEHAVAALEARRDGARRRLRALHARAVEAARLAADADRRTREDLSRLAESLVGALELDRYEFVRLASARGAPELLAPRRRKGGDAALPVPGPVAVAVAEGPPEPRLEPAGGRLAS